MRLAQRAQQIAPFFAMELSKQAQALRDQGHDVIKLNIGEPDFGAAPTVVAAMTQAITEQKTQYTDALGIAPLRQAIAQHYAKPRGAVCADVGGTDAGELCGFGVCGGVEGGDRPFSRTFARAKLGRFTAAF